MNYKANAYADGDAVAGGTDYVSEPSRLEIGCGSLAPKSSNTLFLKAREESTELSELDAQPEMVSTEEELEPESYFGISLRSSSAAVELEPEEFFGIAVTKSAVQIEPDDCLDRVVPTASDEAFGFNFAGSQ